MTRYGGLPSGLMMGLVTGALIGLVNGGLIAWARLSPFIVTLGMLSFLLGFGNEIAHGAPIFGFPNGFEYLAVRDWGPVPAPVAISGIVLILLWMLLARSKIGLYMYAIGAGREACRAAGVPVARYEAIAYTVCGILPDLPVLWSFQGFQLGTSQMVKLFAPVNCCCGHWRNSHRRRRRYSARRYFGSRSPDGAVHGDGHRRIERVLPTYGDGVSNRLICACQPPLELADTVFAPVGCS